MNNRSKSSKTTVGSSGIGDSRYRNLGNGGYDVQHYTLDLDVTDVENSELEATTIIEAEATQDLSSFNLDFIGFEIESITVDGKAAEFDRDGAELTIAPKDSLTAGDKFAIEVEYSGSPEAAISLSEVGGREVPVGWNSYDGGSYVLGEPNGAENYYPVNNHPLDKATYTFRVTTPEPFEVAANGVLEATIDNGDTNTYVFEVTEPMAGYLSTVNIAEGFDLQTQTSASGVLVRNYFAEDVPEEQRKLFDRQPEMLDYFGKIFGDYPFEVYGSLVLDTPVKVGALETQTLSVYGLEAFVVPDIESIIVHELAHQWFGNSVSLSDWGDLWLNESFAAYAQGLWIEERDGTEALDDWIKTQFETVAVDFENLVVPGEPPADDLFNYNSLYTWGSIGLHSLRQEIGDDAFFNSLKTYNERFQGKNVTPEDFIGVVEETSGQELDPLIDRWFYSRELASIPELGLYAGTSKSDSLTTSDADTVEVLAGLDGNDTLLGEASKNVLAGNAGDDVLEGNGIANNIYGGTGDDTIFANGKTNLIIGGDDSDTIWLNDSNNRVILTAGEGQDTINNFQLGLTTLVVRNIEGLSYIKGAEGTEIMQGNDLLATVTDISTAVFIRNADTIFSTSLVE